jgi:D-glycero-D-manno-heptose 1,7-bisphosphate phosphatase
MNPAALILCRDGTLIEHVPYLSDPALVRLLPGVREALLAAQAAGARLFLHSNQSGIGRGYFETAAMDACNQRMIGLLDLGSRPFERICIAPEAPDQPSLYRKPSPQFAREIIRDFALHPDAVCYLGDCGIDLATAQAAGTRGVGITTVLHDLGPNSTAWGSPKNFPFLIPLARLSAIFSPIHEAHRPTHAGFFLSGITRLLPAGGSGGPWCGSHQ